MVRFVPGVVLAACLAVSCGATDATTATTETTTMLPDDVRTWADDFAAISAATVEAWDSRDLEAIRNLYTADITHDDERFGTHLKGIDSIMGMAESMFTSSVPNVRFRASQDFGSGLIGGDGGVMVWEASEVFGYTEDAPLIEVDRLTTQAGRTATWTLHYESSAHDVMAAYATAWGSGDWAQVESLYQPGVVRRDTVFRSDTDGLEQLRTTAEKTFDSRPDTTWTTLLAFGTGLSRGAIFSVDDPQCSVVVAVLIELENDKIAREEIYYDAGSLLACGWLE